MSKVYILLLICECISLTLQSKATDNFYVAAVVEYHTIWPNTSKPRENILANVEKYADIIKTASTNQADIIVFPEIGLTMYDHTEFVSIPNPKDKIVPADSNTEDEVMKKLSEAARNNSIYVVMNIHEKSGTSKYNTNVVFDRNGTVIARYRKHNLFGETYLNEGELEHVTFDTDFGVRFGTFICFDILFSEPPTGLVRTMNITDIVYPTAWFSELPFLTAIQAQNSWAYANDVNLLAANHNHIKAASSGSGLYRGRRMQSYTYSSKIDGSVLIVGKMPKKGNTDKTITSGDKTINLDARQNQDLHLNKEDMSLYKSELLLPENLTESKSMVDIHGDKSEVIGVKVTFLQNKHLCSNNFCCTFNITVVANFYKDGFAPSDATILNNTFNRFRYRVAVANGARGFPNLKRTAGVQICGVIPCINDDINSCNILPKVTDENKFTYTFLNIGKAKLHSTTFDSIVIQGNFDSKNTLIEPTILNEIVKANREEFSYVAFPDFFNTSSLEKDLTGVFMSFKSDQLISGGIYSRVFNRDHKPNGVESLKPSLITLGLLLITLLLYFKSNN